MWAFALSVGSWVRGLKPSTKGFLLGLVVGVMSLTTSWIAWTQRDTSREIALQNANAALDSTRLVLTYEREKVRVYGRLLVQQKVEFTGALAEASKRRGTRGVLAVGVDLQAAGVDTSVTHAVAVAESDDTSRVLRDSLVLVGPPVEGSVAVAVTDSTVVWAAKLRPSRIPLELSAGCGKSGPEFFASGPDWVETEIGTGQVDPSMCHRQPSRWGNGFKTGATLATGIALVLSLIF